VLLRTLDSALVIEEGVHFGWAFGRLDEAFDIHVRAQPGAAHVLQEGLFQVHDEGAAHKAACRREKQSPIHDLGLGFLSRA
jgi:hypothetical protein